VDVLRNIVIEFVELACNVHYGIFRHKAQPDLIKPHGQTVTCWGYQLKILQHNALINGIGGTFSIGKMIPFGHQSGDLLPI
jgi:hypothetical protein